MFIAKVGLQIRESISHYSLYFCISPKISIKKQQQNPQNISMWVFMHVPLPGCLWLPVWLDAGQGLRWVAWSEGQQTEWHSPLRGSFLQNIIHILRHFLPEELAYGLKRKKALKTWAISTYSFINDFHKPSFGQIMSFDSLKKQQTVL